MTIFTAIASVIAAVISAVAAILVAKINTKSSAMQKEQEKQNEEVNAHNKRREQEAVLSGKMVSAICDLSTVTAEAVRGGYTNGNLESAQQKAQSAQEEYEEFLQSIALQDLTK